MNNNYSVSFTDVIIEITTKFLISCLLSYDSEIILIMEILEATEEMCHYCFDMLLMELTRDHIGFTELLYKNNDSISFSISSEDTCPLFVTWDKKTSHTSNSVYNLRGCIGSLSPRPVVSGMRDLALSAALTDRRFQPIQLVELPHLRVGVSLLVQYEDCDHCFDWDVGVHGIIIKFDTHYSATYLPEVASEQKWDQIQTINSLVRKAGYNGVISDNLYQRIVCTRYQSSKKKVTYEEYVHLRHNGKDPVAYYESSKKSNERGFFNLISKRKE